MKLTIGFIVICSTLYAGATSKCPEIADANLETPIGDGILKQVLRKLDCIERIVLELQFGQHELQEQMISNKATQKKTFADVLWAINRVDDRLAKDVGRNLTVLQDQSMLILEQQTACSSHDQLRDKMFNLTLKFNQEWIQPMEWTGTLHKSEMPNCGSSVTSTTQQEGTTSTTGKPTTTIATPRTTTTKTTATPTTPPTTPAMTTTTSKGPLPNLPASCKEVLANASGVYLIHVSNNSAPFQVYCEMDKFGGGWLVVQHRFKGSIDFYQKWDRYRDGFGSLDSEFWLGLEKMHQITKSRNHELIVEMMDFRENYGYARYNGFQIGSESEQYSLKTLGVYSGTAGDSMTGTNKGMKFSTKDREYDVTLSDCAQSFQGGWWYNGCTYANLNGLYRNLVYYKSMHWYTFKNDYNGLSFSRMMIREL